MSKVTRRTALGALSLGAVGFAGYQLRSQADPLPNRPPARTGKNLVVQENRAAGSDQWPVGRADTKGVTDGVSRRKPQSATASPSTFTFLPIPPKSAP